MRDAITEILRLSNIVTTADKLDEHAVSFSSCEPYSTDAIRIIIRTDGKYTIHIMVGESMQGKIDDALYDFDSLEDACVLFKALHFYRDNSVVPAISDMTKMI